MFENVEKNGQVLAEVRMTSAANQAFLMAVALPFSVYAIACSAMVFVRLPAAWKHGHICHEHIIFQNSGNRWAVFGSIATDFWI